LSFFHHVQHTKTFVSATIAIAKKIGLFFQVQDGSGKLTTFFTRQFWKLSNHFRMRSRRKLSYAETISTVSREVLKLLLYFEKQQRTKTTYHLVLTNAGKTFHAIYRR